MVVTPCVICCDVNFISLDVSPTYATLKHDADVQVEMQIYPSGASASWVRLEMRRYDNDTGMFGDGPWCTIAEGSSVSSFRAKIAGFFQVRAVATVCGEEHISDMTELIVRFPSYDEIVADPDVKELMAALWEETVRLSSTPLIWRELGLYIRLDTTTELYDGDKLIYGPEAKPGLNRDNVPYIILGEPEDRPADPSPCAAGADYYVAAFHTHPPSTHVPIPHGTPPDAGSDVGPSAADWNVSRLTELPGIAYDQLPNMLVPVPGTPVTSPGPGNIKVVRPGTAGDAPAGPYQTNTNVDRRPTPEYHSGSQ